MDGLLAVAIVGAPVWLPLVLIYGIGGLIDLWFRLK